MANGDAALAAGMDIVSGDDDRRNGYDEINKTRDYIAERTSEVQPVSKGGTGATSAAQARVNLGVQETVTTVNGATAAPDADTLMRRGTGGRVNVGEPSAPSNAATKSYVDAKPIGITQAAADDRYLPRSGGTVSGSIAVTGYFRSPNTGPATSGYTVAYIDYDGRISKDASSERYKKYISDIDPEALGDIWPQLTRYQRRGGDGTWKYGYIAERLNESDDLRPFVVYQSSTAFDPDTGEPTETTVVLDENGQPVPDSIDFISLLMAQNAQLHQQLGLLAQRIAALEER